MLSLDRISKTYRVGTFGSTELAAVRDVSFDVRPGEVVSLIGESGCGKTTIGRMILRLNSVTRGTLTFDGEDVSALRGAALHAYYRKVQGVFQDPFSSYNPMFKADHAFALLRSTYFGDLSAEEWRARVAASLEAVSLDPGQVLHKFPHQLSGGQLQRMLVARALLLDIRLLVADEIISMLDASTRIDVLNLLGDLKARGLGILFITHDLSLGNYISERTVILRRGRVVEIGDTRKVFGRPSHPYTRALLAAVPHLHERWGAGAGDGEGGLAAADECLYHRTLRELAGPTAAGGSASTAGPASTVGSAPLLAEIEPDHSVACWHIDEPNGCPEASAA